MVKSPSDPDQQAVTMGNSYERSPKCQASCLPLRDNFKTRVGCAFQSCCYILSMQCLLRYNTTDHFLSVSAKAEQRFAGRDFFSHFRKESSLELSRNSSLIKIFHFNAVI